MAADAASRLRELVAPHVDSFDWFLQEGLDKCVADLERAEVEADGADPVTVWIERITVTEAQQSRDGDQKKLWPSECRERGLCYRGALWAAVCRMDPKKLDASGHPTVTRINKKIGTMPLMVKSEKCHLHGLSAKELVRHHEERTELGGYFVWNGARARTPTRPSTRAADVRLSPQATSARSGC